MNSTDSSQHSESESNIMPKSMPIGIIVVGGLIIIFALAFLLNYQPGSNNDSQKSQSVNQAETTGSQTSHSNGLPKLLDLGAGTCIPCKMMVPELEALEKEYQGRLIVEVIDLNQNPSASRQYGIRSIPTQIFYDASGNELGRHMGFISKADMVAKFKEFGIILD